VIRLLALRNLTVRPWRSLLLLAGFGLGVGVMIVLLSIGEAMVTQARDEKLVGGGTVTVLPEGVDIELLKTGGLGGMWFSLPNARFLQLQLLGAPRLAGVVRTAAPQIETKLLYARLPDGREVAVRGVGEIPSASEAVGALPPLTEGAWTDDDGDRRWLAPDPRELLHDIDHFHVTPPGAADRDSWAEWHYFNVLTPDRRRWAFITFSLGGAVPDGAWEGGLLVTLHDQGRPSRRFSGSVRRELVRFSERNADLTLGENEVRVTAAGTYRVRATVPAEEGGAPVTVDLEVAPDRRAYFPGASLGSGDFVSGYVVPGLRASATGRVCAPGWCESLAGAQAYHDHNWGTWRDVRWDWGAARAGGFTFLYGRVLAPGSTDAGPLFVYLVDSLGFRAAFRPADIEYEDTGRAAGPGGRVRVPSRAVMTDVRGADTLRVELEVEDATASRLRLGLADPARTELGNERRPWFVQMKGRARLSGRVGGEPVAGEGSGFFETWR
jgi:hypothetical protein